MNRRTLSATVAAVVFAAVTVGATFTALCGNGAGCSYNGTEPRPGLQTFNLIRTNFNDHETRIAAAIVGLSSSVEKELALFDGTTGKLLERATGTGFVRVASGVYQTPTAQITVAELPVGVPFPVSLALTDAQIKALPTTPITLLPAQGSGKRIVVLMAAVSFVTASGVYTNIDAAGALQIAYAGGPAATGFVPNDAAIAAGSKTRLTDLLGTTTNRSTVLTPYADTEDINEWGQLAEVKDTSAVTNVAVQVSIGNGGSGNLTGGHASNSGSIFAVVVVVP